MGSVTDFKSKANVDAAEQLKAFISWARVTLPKGIPNRVSASIRWEMNSWHPSGVVSASFTALGSKAGTGYANKQYMQPPFSDFAKAIIVYRRVFQGKKSVQEWISALRVLEAALFELTGTHDVTQISAAICNRACELARAYWKKGNNAYMFVKSLERIIELMERKGLLANPFRWSSPLKLKAHRSLKQQRQDRENKLPSRESLQALGELFNNELTDPLDIVITSACALLLSQPSRVGELADIESDCIVFKDHVNGGQRMFLRWYAEKGFGQSLVPVVSGMESVVERLLDRILPITDEARSYAAWLEDHPDEFPPHEWLPDKSLDDPLTYAEVCSALRIKVSGRQSPRSKFKIMFIDYFAKRRAITPLAQTILDEIQTGWDTGKGRPIHGKGRGVKRVEFDDAVITLRKLNILMREKYLPADFPYTTPPEDGKKRVKYRDALFTVRTGVFPSEAPGKLLDFGVEIAATSGRMSYNLGENARGVPNIFERHGYKGVKVNSHAFRHELNTQMHRAGLSQLLIDAFSGRTSMGSVYNHETVEERTQRVAVVHPKTKNNNVAQRLEKVRTNAPLSLSDVTDLEVGSHDRVIHKTHVGICVHNFANEPCPKMGSCLRCGKLACVKGDEEKLKNLKDERAYLKQRYRKAIEAYSQGEFGASEWVTKVKKDLLKCDELIKLLENPELQNGAIVWNVDDGWNLTTNAIAMAGLSAPKIVDPKTQEALPSLDELEAELGEIET